MAQVKTNEKVRFVSVSLQEALQARQDNKCKIAAVKKAISLL
jgi:allophanate hydrolase subunit 2